MGEWEKSHWRRFQAKRWLEKCCDGNLCPCNGNKRPWCEICCTLLTTYKCCWSNATGWAWWERWWTSTLHNIFHKTTTAKVWPTRESRGEGWCVCQRKELYENLSASVSSVVPGHLCSTNCRNLCQSRQGKCVQDRTPYAMTPAEAEPATTSDFRKMNTSDINDLRLALLELQQQYSGRSLFDPSWILWSGCTWHCSKCSKYFFIRLPPEPYPIVFCKTCNWSP